MLAIVKELEWTRKYIERVAHLLPHLPQLKRLSSKKASLNQVQRVHGVCTQYYDKKHFKIVLYTTRSSVTSHEPLTVAIKDYSKIDTLSYLAHELAHMEHWEHSPDHKRLESQITAMFMTILKKDGYISEEQEAIDEKLNF